MSFSSPRSYLTESRSCASPSTPGPLPPPPPPPPFWELMYASFFSMSADMTWSWLDTCDSKSLILVATFLRIWASPPLRPVPPSASPPPPALASSDKTRDSSFLNLSFMSALAASEPFLMVDSISRDSLEMASMANFFTSCSTCDKSAVEASFRVVNMDSVSFMASRTCWHSAPTSARLIFSQALDKSSSTDSVFLCVICMDSIMRFWLASIAPQSGRPTAILRKARSPR
mmetsp:Transcript_49286/g.127881  ORF Transcript_49286/g.127881 Transcript_49286/m.127881 type:complete len:230 (-) Transcript_49286:53-742(-)